MSTPERIFPPMDADERATLEGWLDFYRTTLAQKCAGLSEGQLREASAEPSSLTLLGLVQHMAEVERHWFRRVLTGEDVPTVFSTSVDVQPADRGFALSEDATFAKSRLLWQEEMERARKNSAAHALEDIGIGRFRGSRVSLRWICNHMIAEYARHCGHADLIRERIDGSAGV
ncbi:Mini-circle protein [Streptomyces sp. CB02923]|uniref:DinB family protein n=1 Tax=Streptomyces sp. CB02923 TaxID=1718985 RepID=UPI00093A873A|nr:DinB family protein [Streptomyces sp. CB02923]OKH98091.1 Mini-circle protein [Streptomyces sp. CB02923]